MPKFIPYNYDQSTMVVINFKEQLQPGTFEHALHYLVSEKLNLSVFDAEYNNDDNGRPAYDPAILLKIILFAYSKGITSSREIQWCCETNIIFKALSCDTTPHFTSIASFVSKHPMQIEALFEQILLVCDEQGLLGRELFAIDGCKMSSNAAKKWSGTFKELKEKRLKLRRQIRYHLAEQQRLDQQESRGEAQAQRHEQTIETLSDAAQKIDRFLKTQRPRMGQGRRPTEVKSNITDNDSAKMKTSKGTIQGYTGVAAVDKKHQVIVDAQAFGAGQEHHALVPVLESVVKRFKSLELSNNIYADGTIVTADTGFSNEANIQYLHDNHIDGYIPDHRFRQRDVRFAKQQSKYGKSRQVTKQSDPLHAISIIPASEFTFDPVKLTCVCPAGQQISYQGSRTTRSGLRKAYFVGRLLQCRHCKIKERCMKNPSAADHRQGAGRQVSFRLNEKRQPTCTDWMKHKVDSPYGKQIYGHRMSTVEPVFGNIGSSKRLNRFSLRGQRKVQGQWRLYCMVHNIEKIKNYGQIAA